MNIIIREFTEQDKDFYLRLSKEFYNTTAVDHTVPESYFEGTFNACMSHGLFATGLVLCLDTVKTGYALLSFSYSNEAGGMIVSIEELYIMPQHQKLGLGTALFAYVEDKYVRQNGFKRLKLEATRSNSKAIALYRRLGFTELDYLQMVKDFP